MTVDGAVTRRDAYPETSMTCSSATGLLIMLAVAACHRAPAPVTTPSNTPPPTASRATRDDGAAAREAARRDSVARAARADSARRADEQRRLVEAARQAIIAPVHFEFDRDEIRPGDQSLLDRKAR